jgi:hypothetical protein
MQKPAVLFVLAAMLGTSPALAEGYSGTFTGPKGGTSSYSGSCAAGEGNISCTRESLLTGPEGKTAVRKVDRVWTRDKVTTRATTTGEGGRTFKSTRERLR